MAATGDGGPLLGNRLRAAMICRVREQIVAGATRKDISDYAADQRWTLGQGELSALIDDARAQIAADIKEDRNTEFSIAAERLSGLYRACMFNSRTGELLPRSKQDRRAAFTVLREINELFGLHAPKKFDVADKTVRALSAAQLKEELRLALQTLEGVQVAGELVAREVAGG